MIKNICMVAGFILFCLLISCDFDFNKPSKKGTKPDKSAKKDSLIIPIPNKYSDLFKTLKPQDRNCGLLLGLNTISGYRTLFITYQGGNAEVKTDVPYIIYPYQKTLLYITKLQKDSVFGDILSGWLPDKTLHYWEEIHISDSKKYTDSLRRNWDTHKRQPFFVLTKEKSLVYDSQFIDIDYLISFRASLTFSGRNNHNASTVYSKNSDTYEIDSGLKIVSVKPDGITFINEFDKNRLSKSQLFNFISPPKISELKSKINKELYKKSIDNQFADTILPRLYLDKFKADTTDITFILRREKGIIKLIAQAYALTSDFKISKTYKLKVEYDCGPLQQPYITNNELPLEFNQVSNTFGENIKDVLISPFQNFVIIVGEKSLTGIEVKTGQNLFTYNLSSGNSVIMAEWANINYLYLWEQLLLPPL